MKTFALKRSLVIGIIILIACAFVVPGVAQGTIINVDDDNTTGPWDGTLEHPYQFIQDGVNNASPEDTVYVFNGIYYENVEIHKTLSLRGEDKDSTVIDGNEYSKVVWVLAESVIITGFTIQNSGHNSDDAGIYTQSFYSTVSDNIITQNGSNGIYMGYSEFSTVSGNMITENDSSGIYVSSSWKNSVSGNTITNNADGLHIFDSRYSDFSNNTITDNSKNGIYSFEGRKSCFFGNNITRNNECGIYGIGVFSVNFVLSSNISNNNESGIFVLAGGSNTITNNTIKENGEHGMYLMSDEDHISENNITGNLGWGIYKGENNIGLSLIFHNNFVNNAQNAHDAHESWVDPNAWDAGYPLGGNYWDDFDEPSEGAYDNNGDNIVDDPYNIPGGDSKDRFPLLSPWNDTVLTNPNCGDVNNDVAVNSADLVYLINYLFVGGPEPLPGLCVADCNGDEMINSADIVYLINYLFASGPALESCCKIKIVCGDLTGDRRIDYPDLIFFDNYLNRNGPPPDPLCIADVNGDGTVDHVDISYLTDYVNGIGPPPVEDCCDSLK